MRRNISVCCSTLAVFLFAALLAGCGSANKEGASDPLATATRVDNATCTDFCHAAANSPVTGNNIVNDWKASKHSIVSVDCQSCHGGGSLHWGLGPLPHPNPDADGVCQTCHTPAVLGAPHFNNITTPANATATLPGYPASFVSSRNVNNCRHCHDPHDILNAAGNHPGTNSTLYQQYAESGHGEVTADPWTHYDFKTRDGGCVNCHTTTGFVAYLSSGNQAAPHWGVASDKTKEVLHCNGCHSDYSFKRRDGKTIGYFGVRVRWPTFPGNSLFLQYTTSLNVVTPSRGDADLCINCHTGTKSGRNIAIGPASQLTSNFGGDNSHYFAAAGNLFTAAGYEYLPHAQYVSAGFVHVNLDTDANGVVSVNAGPIYNAGPCVTCHFYSKVHTLKPVVQVLNGTGPRGRINGTIIDFPAYAPVCSNCHSGAGPGPTFGTADINGIKTEYMTRLLALENALIAKGIFYDPSAYPYFYNSANTATRQAFTAWGDKGTLGAAFNLNFCFREPGGYVHNHQYTARLIYDSLDFLDDGLLNGSANAAFGDVRP